VNSYSKLKAMVEANAVEWDVMQIDSAPAATNARLGLLEQLDHGVIDKSDLIPGVPREHYLPCDVAAAVMAWNTKNLKPEQVPHSWSDMWDLKRFSGQRGFWKQPFQVMEFALVADGVPKDSYTRSTLIVPSRALTASSPKSSGGPAAPSRPRS
jgi:putative spermidine/putrescine transport system substrate-binding protein